MKRIKIKKYIKLSPIYLIWVLRGYLGFKSKPSQIKENECELHNGDIVHVLRPWWHVSCQQYVTKESLKQAITLAAFLSSEILTDNSLYRNIFLEVKAQ